MTEMTDEQSREVLEANRVPEEEQASLEEALSDDTGGFYWGVYSLLADSFGRTRPTNIEMLSQPMLNISAPTSPQSP